MKRSPKHLPDRRGSMQRIRILDGPGRLIHNQPMSIETRQFGRTGHASSRVIFGGAALRGISQDEADRVLELLLRHGVNHLDVAASYGDGEAESHMGPWMAEHRNEFFLATKTGKRSYREALDEFHGSLERLRVESVDLIQMHNLTDPDEWEQAFSHGGALEALIEAREQGLARFIGVTGHGYTAAEMHLESFERFGFDSVLLPYNYVMMQNQLYARSFEKLEQRCVESDAALQTIKCLACRPWQGERNHPTWYQPLEEAEAIRKAVSWVLGNQNVFLVSTADIQLLPRILEAAGRTGSRPSEADMQQMLQRYDMQPIFRGTGPVSQKGPDGTGVSGARFLQE